MRDELQRNPGTISGTPTVLTPGMLRRDSDPDLRFAGGSSFSIPHSSTLNLLNGAVGGLAIAFMLNVPAYPATDKLLLDKPGEYALWLKADGTLMFSLTGGSVVSSAPIPLDEDKFITLVYNGDYSGVTEFGYSTQGASSVGLEPDYIAGAASGFQNLTVCQFELQERAQLDTIHADLVRFSDHPYTQWVAPVLYDDTGANLPGDLLWQGDPIFIDASFATRQWVSQDAPMVLDPGMYWPGMIGGNVFSGASEHPVTLIGGETSGGLRKTKNAVVTEGGSYALTGSAPSPFGTPGGSDAKKLSIYGDYTAIARTGDEGNLLIYIDGQEDARAAYTSGVTAGTSALAGPTTDVKMGELLLWNRKLGPVEVAQLYAAR